jgi:anaerobic dimethyl sulfoxide reductase subunit B (iron-sulfur subunit)
MAACHSWHELEQEAPDMIDILARESGEFPDVSLTHLFITCFHCEWPACITACPDTLLVKRAEDGIVVITESALCTGCQLCVEACPYNAPRVVPGGVGIVKCDMCLDRLSEGRPPACVATCPTEALDAGPMEDLMRRYGELRELEGLADYRQTGPSVVFRAMSTE